MYFNFTIAGELVSRQGLGTRLYRASHNVGNTRLQHLCIKFGKSLLTLSKQFHRQHYQSHLNPFRSAFDWLHRKECALSEVITRISLRICIPTSSTICFRTQGFFMLSTATVFWLLRATAFPRCFRRGVKTYVFGFLYPTCIYEMKYECILTEKTGICL